MDNLQRIPQKKKMCQSLLLKGGMEKNAQY